MTPKTRFQVLQRDRFTCRYCGRQRVRELPWNELFLPGCRYHGDMEAALRHLGLVPDVELEVDHVIPRADGGTDDLANLVTACRECNRGKGCRSLDYVG